MYKCLILGVLFSIGAYGQKDNNSTLYISMYKDIAVDEMHRTGIPASIKMAQALLESAAGKSTLATQANNHFGIKCGGSWTGETFYREDDDYVKGKLVQSCFRKFTSVYESYIAHSEFLTTQNRYAFLFDIHHTDYTAWARGLKKAGYATDKAYPNKLINLIEKYQLYKLDQEDTEIFADASDTTPPEPYIIKESKKTRTSAEERRKKLKSRKGSKSYAENSKKKDRSRKKKSVRSNKNYHVVASHESIADIARLYGCDENALRIRNRLPKNAQPLEGEKIYLKKKISLLKRPKFVRNPDNSAIASNEFMF